MTRVQELAASVKTHWRFYPNDPSYWKSAAEAVLAELVALAEVGAEHAEEHADWRTMRAERAEALARVGELERERDEALANADGMARAPYGEFNKMRDQRDEARKKLRAAARERDELRAVIVKVLDEPMSEEADNWLRAALDHTSDS